MRVRLRRIALIVVGLTLFALVLAVVLAGDLRRRVILKYKNEGVGGVLRAAVNRIAPAPQTKGREAIAPLDAVLALLAEQPSFSVVQIGAYIGNTPNDPLFPFLQKHLDPAKAGAKQNAKVVLVEPIREYFDLLCENYANLPSVECEQVAIAEAEGIREMYRLKVDPVEYGYPAWLSQLSSLKEDRMGELWDEYERHPEYKRFYLENRIVERVQGMTLQQLLDQHQIGQLDLLQVDAEGYDFEILKTLDFEKIKPRFINYERVLLQDDEPACRRMLSAQGYLLIDWGQDTLCIRMD